MSKGLTKIEGSAFYNCKSLEEIIIPDSVTEIGAYAFCNCSNLSNLKLSTNLVSFGSGAFENCDGLTQVHIPKSLDEAGSYGAFRNCDNLKTVTFEEGVKEVSNNLFDDCTGLEEIVLPDTITIVEGGAFFNCNNLRKVTLPKGLNKIEGSAFYNCKSLEEIIIPDSVTEIGGYAFTNCTNLQKAVLPNTLVEIIDSMFSGCSSLTAIELPATIQYICSSAFQNAGLETITLPENVIRIDSSAFKNNDSLTKVVMGDKVEYIGSYAFSDCALLSDIELSESLKGIEYNAFQNCDSLASITIPNSVTYMGSYAFENCDALAEIKFGSGLTEIASYAFNLCPALKSVVLPYRIESVSNNAFTNCTGLTELTVPRATTSIGNNAVSYATKMTVYGISGTYAETWANEVGATFVNKEVHATELHLDKDTLTMNRGDSVPLNVTIEPEGVTDVISWRSSDTDVATVSELGVVKAVGVGSATIRVTVGDCSASCKVTVVQPVTSISIDRGSLSMEALSTYQLTATIYPNNAHNKAIEWSSSNEEVATVDASGKVTAIGKGSATITVKALDGSEKTDTCNVTVTNNGYVCTTPQAMESEHNYEVNCNDFWIYTDETASVLQIAFDERTNIEEDFDYLYIYNAAGEQVGKYTGTELAGQVIEVAGNSVKIKLESDGAGTEWGFKVVNIFAVNEPLPEPTANIASGSEVVEGTTIVLSSEEGASIYYTTDGSEPSITSTLYTEPILLTEDVTIKVFAVKGGYANSPVVEFSYKVLLKYMVTLDTNGGSTQVSTKEVYFGKTYGELPIPTKMNYIFKGWYTEREAGVLVTAASIVGIQENHTLYAHWEEMPQAAIPVASIPTESEVEAGTEVVLSSTIEGASVYYTLDGTTPTITSRLYTKPIIITTDVIIKAIVVKDGYRNSGIAEFRYYLKPDREEEVINTGTCGEDIIWTLYEDGTLKINGKGEMEDFDTYSPWYNEYRSLIEKVEFGEGITHIGAYAFYSHNNLQVVTFSSTITSIGDRAFEGCENLTVVELPNGLEQLGERCFVDTGLKNVELPSTIKEVNNSFHNCELERLIVKSKMEFSIEGVNALNVKTICGYKDTFIHKFAVEKEIPFYDIETGELCKPLDYYITYVLDGGINNIANPIGYREGETVILFEAVKEGMKFGGWFLENGTRITSVSGQSITLYAKWIKGDEFWIEDIESQIYQGQAIKPEVRVYDGDTLLEEKVDYTISYKNNTKAASENAVKNAPSITIIGKGNYTGKETVTFTIEAKNIAEEDVLVTPMIAKYNKKVQKPVPTLTYNGKKLKNKTDFTIEYTDTSEGAYKEAGTYTFLIKGKGNFVGEREVIFTITENILMSKVSVAKIKNQAYTGIDIMPELTVKSGKTYLQEGVDYTTEYENNVDIGTATVILTGMGSYSGEKRVTFKITGNSISKAKVTGVPKSVAYTGEEITVDSLCWEEEPVLTTTVNKEVVTLEEGWDYTISYQKNINKGTATILFTGMNGYTGVLKKTFKITAYDMKQNISEAIETELDTDVLYEKGGSKPKPIVRFGNTVLVEGKDYTLTYKNHTKVNDGSDPKKIPTVILKGKGNFSGSISLNYTIEAQSLSELTISVPDKVYTNKKNAYKSTPKLVDLNGKVLSVGIDYEKTFEYTYKDETVLADGTIREVGDIVGTSDIVPAGTVIVVTVSGKGNYETDTILQGEYRIVEANLSNASVKISAQTYNGEEICLSKEDITVKIGKVILEDSDYEIVSYENNINKGKAKVTIKGVGNYGGTKTITFTIKAKGLLWWWR